jgi:hypothetical protein
MAARYSNLARSVQPDVAPSVRAATISAVREVEVMSTVRANPKRPRNLYELILLAVKTRFAMMQSFRSRAFLPMSQEGICWLCAYSSWQGASKSLRGL